ncbi:MAG: SDR family NAD(P)-dependent oxidoreductase [Pseudomonadota bacterium]
MIILTGASGGIGKELIHQLCKLDDVIGLYNNSIPNSSEDKKLIYEKLNINDPLEVQNFVNKWESKLSKVTLIHCAAAKVDGLAAHYDLSDWDHVMDVNLRGNFILTKALLPYMINGRWGRIIHISSHGGMDGDAGTIAYSASKTGLIGMSRVLGKEYARFQITSNVLVLGTFETGMFLKLSDEHKNKIRNKIPSKTFGDISNITTTVDYLMKAEYVNASVINIDGGMS